MKAKQYRKKAWKSLSGRYWWTVLAGMISLIFTAIVCEYINIYSAIHGDDSSIYSLYLDKIKDFPQPVYIAIYIGIFCLFIIGLIMSLLSCSVRLGYCRFNMDLYTDVQRPSINLLFSRTDIFWKAVWLHILIYLKVIAWSLLLVVPGIIAAYRYSQAVYILAENPELSSVEAIAKSCELMRGKKWKLFCLQLSYFGWAIVSALFPFCGTILLTPYYESCMAAFYLGITGRLNDDYKDLADIELKS